MKLISILALTVAVFWNLENFFDFNADNVSDSETGFSAEGSRKWSKTRFYRKCDDVGKTLLVICDRAERFPDFIGFAEVENRFVARRICTSAALCKFKLGIVHFDSPDRRGIDCALLYRKEYAQLLSAKPCHIYDSTGVIMATRDILLAVFLQSSGDTLAVLVNHHPSKVGSGGGAGRAAAMARMQGLCDSLRRAGIGRIISMGDFNDNVWKDSAGGDKTGKGTIKYNGAWEKIDGAFSFGLDVREEVIDFPHLLIRDKAFGGYKPLRTYSGPRYLGGISDHLPVLFEF